MEKKSPHIVILDGYTANPGDLSWEALSSLGSLTIYDHLPPKEEELLERAKEADILLINKAKLNRGVLEKLPNLKYISILATGYDVVDIAAARELGIKVSNTPAYSRDSVVQHVFALILEHYVNVGGHTRAVREGKWASSPDFSFTLAPTRELAGKTLGIVGMGNIGRQTAAVGKAFGMKVVATTRTPKEVEGVTFLSPEELFQTSDIISLHCPLTPATKELINEKSLSLMKKEALLINTGRGGLIDEKALFRALQEGKIAAAALDVLSTEPPEKDHPLTRLDNCIVTPHIAWATKEARTRLLAIAAENVRNFLAGTPVNIVN